MKPQIRRAVVCAVGLCLALPAWAQNVKVESAWVRTPVPGQRATGGYMTLTSPQALRLVGVASPVAKVAEIHEMKMDGDVMRMRPLPGLDLPAGQPVVLRPGGLHLMLQELNTSVPAASSVTLTLSFEDTKGKRSTQVVQVPLALQSPVAAAR